MLRFLLSKAESGCVNHNFIRRKGKTRNAVKAVSFPTQVSPYYKVTWEKMKVAKLAAIRVAVSSPRLSTTIAEER